MTTTRSKYQRAILLHRRHAPAQTRDTTKQSAPAARMPRAATGNSHASAPAARSVAATYPANDHLNPANHRSAPVFCCSCFNKATLRIPSRISS